MCFRMVYMFDYWIVKRRRQFARASLLGIFFSRRSFHYPTVQCIVYDISFSDAHSGDQEKITGPWGDDYTVH